MSKRYFIITFLLLLGWQSKAQFISNNGIGLVNSNDITTNGDWTNAAGTVLVNHGSVETSDSFINNGTLDPSSSGGFILVYGTDLNFQPGGTRMGFLRKEGLGAALVTGTIGVRDSISLIDGVVRLVNANDTVFISGQALIMRTATSYVEGLVSRSGSGNLVFPLGAGGDALTLTMNKANAKKLTASLIPAPAGVTAGPGLDSLINFPYAWKVVKEVATDTAAYVEVNYPTRLPQAITPIIAKQNNSAQFVSMGARYANVASGLVTVRSYSRAAQGIFTVAAGFQGDFATDSLALVALHNSTNGNAWLRKTNWLSGTVDTWEGVTMNGQSITALDLNTNQLSGNVPDQLADIAALQTLNLSGNALTSVPDFSANSEITSLDVSNNKLTFASLEPNATVAGLVYSNQGAYGIATHQETAVGNDIVVEANAGGSNTTYAWKRNGNSVSGSTGPTFTITSVGRTNMGDYTAEATNSLLPGLTITSQPQTALAYATVNGTLFIEPSVAATSGSVKLYRVQNTAFQVVDTVSVASNGSYTFNNVILDDYQILGFADTLVYERALPTYYRNTIFWEEADTLMLDNNISNLDIVSILKPAPPTGQGSITGFLEEEVPDGRTKNTQKAKRIEDAGVSARRVENTGRGKQEVLTLVAYVFTNENGEFRLPDLPTGNYRLNMQYPGYPMDTTSFINVPIGTALQSQVAVEAHVLDGKINVTKLVITGLYQEEKYQVDVYPNPAAEFVHMRFDSESKTRILDMFTMSGSKVSSVPANEKEAQMSVKHLPKGLYILKISDENRTVKTLKVSIE